MTPTAVGLVLVEGQDADGATVDRNAIEIPGRRATPQQTSDEAAAAVLRSEAIAATRGHRLHSIGVTWSDDADLEASLLLRSLNECGFDNVVPVRLPEASEALAWGVAEVIGNEVTAVCVIESDTVIALVVHAREGAVQTAVNHAVDSEDALARWLSAVFAKADWRPEALVLVGSGSGLDDLMPWLEDVLGVPVFAPAEAELALARGAALASAHSTDTGLADVAERYGDPSPGPVRRQLALTGPLAMLAAGIVTFVASVSVAISMQLAPDKDTARAEPSPAAKSSPDIAAASEPRPIATPAPAVLPAAPPVEQAPPPIELPAEPPAVAVDMPPAPEAPAPEIPQAPPPAPVAPPDPALAAVPAAPPLPPESMAPGLVPAQPTPVPERRGFLQRIRDRLDFGNDDAAAVQQAPPPDPALAPPPPPPPAPVEPPPAPPLPPA